MHTALKTPSSDETLAERVDALARRVDIRLAPVPFGRYELDAVIGRGAQGVVFSAWDRELERDVALKLLRREPNLDEARMLARLVHPHIVRLYDAGIVDGFAYLAMELGEWSSLAHRIRDAEWSEIVTLFVQAGRGLAAAHRVGIVHGDVKPGNMLIGADGLVRIADFGQARNEQSDGLADEVLLEILGTASESFDAPTPPIVIGGTPGYRAPECVLGLPPTPSSDQFSFCVALWEALYGTRPWPDVRKTFVAAPPDKPGARFGAPRSIERLLRRGLAADAWDRFPSMDALCDSLVRAVDRRLTRRLTITATAVLLAMGVLLGRVSLSGG
jgi:eukaryotic-like serine/threonine-protein kinase